MSETIEMNKNPPINNLKNGQIKEQTLTATIEKLSHDVRGIARIEGKTTFIQGALEGETVTFTRLKRKRDFDEGIVTSIIVASDDRVEPKCAHFNLCGGCSLQHMDIEAQRSEKQTMLLDMLARIGHCQPEEILNPLFANTWHYRNKARLSVRYVEKKQSVLVGFREKNNPRYITEITHCPVLNAKVDEHLLALRGLIFSLDDPKSIAQVEVAAGDEGIALIFRNMTILSADDETKLIAFAQTTGFQIYLQPAGPNSVYRLYPNTGAEMLSYQLPDEGLTFSFHPTDFTQINASLNRLMVKQAMELLTLNSEDVVLDLFCGLGNFSLPLAKRASNVIGVEGSETMVTRAKDNAKQNGLTNVEFYAANLDDMSIMSTLQRHRANKLLLDPPRAGAFELVKQMEKLKPERIVYVSCNPATLARDAGVLVNEKGYQLKLAGIMDMFPHTEHVESIALFVRG